MQEIVGKRDVYTFAPGPSMLPLKVLQKAYGQILDWNNVGLGVMEISHRSKEFLGILTRAEESARQFFSVPDNYQVLFMQGGASLQNAAVPLNLLHGQNVANYLTTGFWGHRSLEEASQYCTPNQVTPIPKTFNFIPDRSTWNINKEGAYFYYTDCETVDGLEFLSKPDVPDQILVSDMTSSLGTKKLNIKDYGCIFASCQKNLGCAGDTLIIVRDDLIGKHHQNTPSMFHYKTFSDTKSNFNTAPVYPIYMTGLVLDYLLSAPGGIEFWEQLTCAQSKLIYDVIDQSRGFYQGRVLNPEHRSRTNIVWSVLGGNQDLEKKFVEEASQHHLINLAGHFSTKGLRANIYNGMPLQGVKALRDFMLDFQSKHSEKQK